jgi:hypothetical protein
MQVQLRESRVAGGFAQRPGDVVEVSEDEGGRMIAAGQAVPFGPGGGAAETRSETEPEGEVKTAARGRGRPSNQTA